MCLYGCSTIGCMCAYVLSTGECKAVAVGLWLHRAALCPSKWGHIGRSGPAASQFLLNSLQFETERLRVHWFYNYPPFLVYHLFLKFANLFYLILYRCVYEGVTPLPFLSPPLVHNYFRVCQRSKPYQTCHRSCPQIMSIWAFTHVPSECKICMEFKGRSWKDVEARLKILPIH